MAVMMNSSGCTYIYIYIYIYIGTIHVIHRDIALKVIEAGKPVLCEKLITITSSDTKKMIGKKLNDC